MNSSNQQKKEGTANDLVTFVILFIGAFVLVGQIASGYHG